MEDPGSKPRCFGAAGWEVTIKTPEKGAASGRFSFGLTLQDHLTMQLDETCDTAKTWPCSCPSLLDRQ